MFASEAPPSTCRRIFSLLIQLFYAKRTRLWIRRAGPAARAGRAADDRARQGECRPLERGVMRHVARFSHFLPVRVSTAALNSGAKDSTVILPGSTRKTASF